MNIMTFKIVRTTALDHAIAEEFFGWRWMAHRGIPIRGTEGYPRKRMVRRFHSPDTITSGRWKEYWKRTEGRLADGTEPLDYSYCSSAGPEIVPHFSGDIGAVAILERDLQDRFLWDDYRKQLQVQMSRQSAEDPIIDERLIATADCETRCIAALAIVNSTQLGLLGIMPKE